ncbi:MAG: CpsD/CapB family tyrosine-protein kinase [Clostridia bacterium]|nr:CpsD/CapB family tyrosine-protein kinase [Clostridia bacterium]
MRLFSSDAARIKRDKKLKDKARNSDARRTEYLLNENISFDVSEAFRNLKASISLSIPKKQSGEGTVIVMTSACPEDGKTTVSVNLALMFAMSEAKVVLVDADVRKGRVARFFRKRSAPGLADFLSGQSDLSSIVHRSHENENFSYITCGTHSPRPYELLESDEMKNLIAELKKEYDYVVVDTPPLLLVSDALAITSEADGAVVVCRHQVSYVSDIAKTLNTLSFAKANVLGVVVNDYDAREKLSYRSDRYKYYSYCYDSTAETAQKKE